MNKSFESTITMDSPELVGCGPGRPDVADEVVDDVLKKFYGLQLGSLRKLRSHDDYIAEITYTQLDNSASGNGGIQKGIIKIAGFDNSSRPEFQQFIGPLLDFAYKEGVPVSAPTKRVDGSLISPKINLVHSGNSTCAGHYVHLLSYIEGTPLIMMSCTFSDELIQQISSLTARLHGAVMKCPEPIPCRIPTPWYLVDIQLIHEKVEEVDLSSHDASLVKKSVDEFIYFLNKNEFTQCLVHGDITGNNIIMVDDNSTQTRIAGLIDFADMVVAPAVIDLAVFAIARWTADWPSDLTLLHILTQVLKGYCANSSFRISDADLELLYYALPARCAQYTVLCKYDAIRDTGNQEYLLANIDNMLKAMREFYKIYEDKNNFLTSLTNYIR